MLPAAREVHSASRHSLLTSVLVPLGALIIFGLREARCPLGDIVRVLSAVTQGATSLWTTVLGGRKHSSSSFELEVPSARAASGPDTTLAPTGHSDGAQREHSVAV